MVASPRYLLLQARNPGDAMARHEHECFSRTLRTDVDHVECWNLLQGAPDEAALRRTDLILVGGSGDFSICDSDPFIRQFIDFMGEVCVQRQLPTFGSCFGFQALVVAGGGEVIQDKSTAEVGTFDIHVTTEGGSDPLLGRLAPTFKAQLGHKDRASRLPSGMTHLAYSDRVPYQCVRVGDGPVFATQFHPELDRDANTMRYLRYQAGYSANNATEPEDEVLSSMADTPQASDLLRRWVTEVQAGQETA
jgi:GMP synthase (glutamine-hydrolysing)